MRGCIAITPVQVVAVAACLAPRDRALFVVGVRTGFRITELLSLSVGDVWTGECVRDSIAVRRSRMKGKASGRSVVLHAEAKAALELYLQIRIGKEVGESLLTEPLFLSRKGGSLGRKSAWRVIHAALVAAGVAGVRGQLGTHVMRKTFAGVVYDKLGRDLVKTQRALGHRSIQSTALYLSFDESEITAAILAA